MAKKQAAITTTLTYEEMFKALRAYKGARAVMGADIPVMCTTRHLRTNIPTLDYLGGLIEGRVTVLAGKTGSGKSTMTLMCIAAMQRKWKAAGVHRFVVYVDSEGSYDHPYATALGVDNDYMIILQEKCIETAFKDVDDRISTGFIGGLVIDSLDTMISRKVDDSGYGNSMGGTAGAVSMHFPTLFSKIVEHDVTTIIIKQARVKMGFTGGAEIITFNGGYFLRHIADSIFMVNRLSSKDLDYTKISIKAEKTRSSRMGLKLEIPLGTGEIVGVDRVRDLFALASLHDKLDVSGSWYVLDYPGMEAPIRVQGSDKVIAYIRSNPTVLAAFEKMVYEEIIDVSTLVCDSIEDDTIFRDEDETTESLATPEVKSEEP